MVTPDLHEPFQRPLDQYDKENTILAQVKCELKEGVTRTINAYSKSGPGLGYDAEWLTRWAAKIDLKTSAQETGGLNPTFSYNDIPPIFSFGAALGGNADATRTESIGITWSVQELLRENIAIPCKKIGGYQIESDLKISDFLQRKAFLARVPGNISKTKLQSPYSVFSYQSTFISSYNGSINPAWKFTQVGINNSSTLASISRSRTDDITITMGPAEKDEFGGYRLTETAEDVRRALLFGQAVRTRIFPVF
ncbi:hypothetical protein [Methylobacterium sp. OAE515]|uniref:hypothetical protein n=1 Tax=Methylobacterium sp. OAE515 TaxID=2817895 RepID=UPI00178ADA8E